ALVDRELHAYALRSAVLKASLGSIYPSDTQIGRVLGKLHAEGLIDITGSRPTRKSGKIRMHYQISEEGLIRLQEELTRLEHAVKIGRNAGLMDNPIPTEIQRLNLKARS
ncbi:MAG TPA: PadR family transcriptional regulator, partial [Candidatus Saccharimonadia bacterium]|nr:PadR family transcriptional regulator [Candidatus Saccharimonadia bacterium]